MRVLARCGLGGIVASVIGWLTYAWVLDFSYPTGAIGPASQSIQDIVFHKIIYTGSVSLLGVVLGFYSDKGVKEFFLLLIAAIVSMVLWLLFIRHRLEVLRSNVRDIAGLESFRLNIEAVPIFEAGLFAALFVVLSMSVISLIRMKRRQ